MSNTITIEFCTEDRARIDNLTAALIANGLGIDGEQFDLCPALRADLFDDRGCLGFSLAAV